MKRHILIVSVLIALTLASVMTACDQRRAPTEANAPSERPEPVVVVDALAKTVTISDPAQPEKVLVVRVDPVYRTQHFEYGEFHLVSGPGYVQAYAPGEFFEASVVRLDDNRHVERYFYDGRVLELEIDDTVGPTAEQIETYRNFYPICETSDLHPDARAMQDLLTRAEPRLAQVFQEPVRAPLRGAKDGGVPEPGPRPDWANYVCPLAETCTIIACMFGPNPICIACASVWIACIIMDTFDLW